MVENNFSSFLLVKGKREKGKGVLFHFFFFLFLFSFFLSFCYYYYLYMSVYMLDYRSEESDISERGVRTVHRPLHRSTVAAQKSDQQGTSKRERGRLTTTTQCTHAMRNFAIRSEKKKNETVDGKSVAMRRHKKKKGL